VSGNEGFTAQIHKAAMCWDEGEFRTSSEKSKQHKETHFSIPIALSFSIFAGPIDPVAKTDYALQQFHSDVSYLLANPHKPQYFHGA
jgi:hypothetical protein